MGTNKFTPCLAQEQKWRECTRDGVAKTLYKRESAAGPFFMRINWTLPSSDHNLIVAHPLFRYLCWNFRTIYWGQEPSMNRVVVPAANLDRLAELIPWNRLLGFLKVLKYDLRIQIWRSGKPVPRESSRRFKNGTSCGSYNCTVVDMELGFFLRQIIFGESLKYKDDIRFSSLIHNSILRVLCYHKVNNFLWVLLFTVKFAEIRHAHYLLILMMHHQNHLP
jgi:hypothetical protein